MRTAFLPPAPKKARRSEVSRQLDESVFCEDDDDDDSEYIMYFVRIPTIDDDCPTEEEATVHADLFKTLNDSGFDSEWIDADEIFVREHKSEFYIVPAFRGSIFRRLANEGYRIYGPPIVAECLENQKPLPRWTHPIYSSVFEGAQITFTGLSPERKGEIEEKIWWMNGITSGKLFEPMTHLIADKADSCSDKYRAARRMNVVVMRKEWVEELWQKTQLTLGKFSAINDDVVNSYKMRIFEGLEFTLTKIDGIDRSNTIKLIEENGGKVSGNMSRKTCTHLVTDQMSGAKYKKAIEWGNIRVVQQRWVRKCVEHGGVVDEAKYHPKYLTATAVEHFRSSTPQKESPVMQSFADVSSISGAGGRLNCSMNSSNVSVIAHQQQQQRVFERANSSSHVSASNIESPVGSGGSQKRVARQSTSVCDPIDTLCLKDNQDSDLFESMKFWLCGIDEKKLDKWRRLIDRFGGTRPNKIDLADYVIVVSPNENEKVVLRRFLAEQSVKIVNAKWIIECLEQEQVVSCEGFEWNPNNMEETLVQKSTENINIPTKSADSSLTTFSEEPATKIIGIFSARRFFVHETSPKHIIEKYSEIIRKNGGILTDSAENAEYVVFDHSAPINTLLSFDAVITYLYIETCVRQSKLLDVGHPLFVPLPRPIMPIFRGVNVILYIRDELIYNYLKDLVEVSGGTVHANSVQAKEISYIVMMEKYDVNKIDENLRMKTCDLSWIISSIANCRRLPFNDHLFKGQPLDGFERDDDVWVKCTNDKDNATIIMAADENNYEMEEDNIQEKEERTEYKTDLTKPYKIRLKNLDEIHEKIDAIPSPSRMDSEESMSTSRIGIILKKAVENTGRRNETKKEQEEEYTKFEIHRRFVFSCSDMKAEARAEMRSIVMSLNGSVDDGFTFQTTHVICAKVNRTPKAVCAIAAGKWCLLPDYLYDSQKAGKWLDERKYEWTPEKLTTKRSDVEMKMVTRCRYWREKIEQMPITMSVTMESRTNGAFSDWKCVIHADDERARLILPILEAGGAQVFTICQYTEVIPLNPTHVFAAKDFAWNPQSVAQLRRESINLLLLEYIFEFLIDENVNVTKFLKSSP